MFFSLRPLSMPSLVLPKLATFTLSLHLLFEPQPYNFSTVVCLIHFFKSVFKNLTSKKKRTSLLYIASSYSVKFLKYQFCYLTVSVFNIHENVQFSCSVVSDSLRPRGLQHARPPCPSLSPRVCSNSCPWSRWCPPTISSSAAHFHFGLQSFPAPGTFPVARGEF